MLRSLATIALIFIFSSCVFADTLYGTIKYKDQEKEKRKNTENSNIVINTSWDYAKTATIDGQGNYKIDFNEKVGQKISVFINGKKYIEVEVKGDTKLDIVVP